MGDANQRSSAHLLFQFCVFVSLIFATKTKDLYIMSPQPCHADKGGSMYVGSRNVTNSGKACQPWAENSPHQVDSSITDNQFPDGSKIAAKNYCRNPGKQDKWGVWCYTMDPNVTWDFCHVCLGDYDGYSGCVLSDKGENYKGVLTHTRSFQVCEFWKDHPDPLFKFPDGSAQDAQNFCRNPNPKEREAPWCFIAPVRGATWDYCDICTPFEGRITPLGELTSGTALKHTDMSRLACFNWCITFAYCMGVVVTPTNNECWYYSKFRENPSSAGHENFQIDRTCNRNTAGKNGYFLDYIGVKSQDLTPLLSNASIEKCDEKCFEKFSTCSYYEFDTRSKECRSWYPYCCPKEEPDDGGVLTRLSVYCNASLEPSTDVQKELGLTTQTASVTAQSRKLEAEISQTTKEAAEKTELQEEKSKEQAGKEELKEEKPLKEEKAEKSKEEEKGELKEEKLQKEEKAEKSKEEEKEELKEEKPKKGEKAENSTEEAEKGEPKEEKPLNEEKAENSTEEVAKDTKPEKSSSLGIVIAVIAVIIVVALVCGVCAYYKLVYLKDKEKDKGKVEDKGKDKDKDKGKVDDKGKDGGKGIGKVASKIGDKGKLEEKVKDIIGKGPTPPKAGVKGEREQLIPKKAASTSKVSSAMSKSSASKQSSAITNNSSAISGSSVSGTVQSEFELKKK